DAAFLGRLKKTFLRVQEQVYPLSNETIRQFFSPSLSDFENPSGPPMPGMPALADLNLKEERFSSFMRVKVEEGTLLILNPEQYALLFQSNGHALGEPVDRGGTLEYAVMLARLVRASKRAFFRTKPNQPFSKIQSDLAEKIERAIFSWTVFLLSGTDPISKEEATRLSYIIQSISGDESVMGKIVHDFSQKEMSDHFNAEVKNIFKTHLASTSPAFCSVVTAIDVNTENIFKKRERLRQERQENILKALENPWIPTSLFKEMMAQLNDPPLLSPLVLKECIDRLSSLPPPSDPSPMSIEERLAGYSFFNTFRFAFIQHIVSVLEANGYQITEEDRKSVQAFREKEGIEPKKLAELWATAHETQSLQERLKNGLEIATLEKQLAKDKKKGKENLELEQKIMLKKMELLKLAGATPSILSSEMIATSYDALQKTGQAKLTLLPALIGAGLSASIVSNFMKAVQVVAELPHESSLVELYNQDEISFISMLGPYEWRRAVWLGEKVIDKTFDSPDTKKLREQFPQIAAEQERRLCRVILNLNEQKESVNLRFTDDLLAYARKHQ
ncbi:MAG: hypothetical protein Q7T03_05320, partial [Deltaproteobacteria bacterium]|nr:hypothetical protein [Deltaproteobacteria bacterium]